MNGFRIVAITLVLRARARERAYERIENSSPLFLQRERIRCWLAIEFKREKATREKETDRNKNEREKLRKERKK